MMLIFKVLFKYPILLNLSFSACQCLPFLLLVNMTDFAPGLSIKKNKLMCDSVKCTTQVQVDDISCSSFVTNTLTLIEGH